MLRLLNVRATVCPVNEPARFLGIEPFLIACLCEDALRIRVVSSVGVRSAIERKCLGAKGEVGGVAGVELEYCRNWGLGISRTARELDDSNILEE